MQQKKPRLGRICKKCKERFIPSGKFTYVCDKCKGIDKRLQNNGNYIIKGKENSK